MSLNIHQCRTSRLYALFPAKRTIVMTSIDETRRAGKRLRQLPINSSTGSGLLLSCQKCCIGCGRH